MDLLKNVEIPPITVRLEESTLVNVYITGMLLGVSLMVAYILLVKRAK